jgi:hypothetical protein
LEEGSWSDRDWREYNKGNMKERQSNGAMRWRRHKRWGVNEIFLKNGLKEWYKTGVTGGVNGKAEE